MSPKLPAVGPEEWAKRIRLQRSSLWNEFVERELQIWRCTNILNATHRGQDITLKYDKSRPYRLDGGYRRVRQRELFCWIYLNNSIVGAFEMIEIDASDAEPKDLVGAMDSVSQYAYELARVIRRGWKYLPAITSFGTILDFKRVWMDPAHARTGLWAEAARTMIDAEFPKHAVMVMKAFPLEYEGKADVTNAIAFKRRQRAMARYYGSLFGVKPFPGRDGGEGWLWRAHTRWEGIIDDPASPTAYL